MTATRGRPALASDDWMLEQQVRAEMEAEAWRRLRADLATPAPAPVAIPAAPAAEAIDHHTAGSLILKALVRFALAAFGAYLCWLAAIDSQLGSFEALLAAGAGFAITLALSMFGYAREFVHMLAETARWAIICALALGAAWMLFQMA
jgi:hypothetical protein